MARGRESKLSTCLQALPLIEEIKGERACVTALVLALRNLNGRYIQQSRVLWILAIIILPIDLAPEMGWFTVVATFIYTLR